MKYHGHRYNRNLRYLFITHELHFHFVTIKYTPRNPISTLQFPFPRIVTRISNSNRSTTSRTRIEQHHYLIISFRIFLDKKKKMKKYIYTYIYTNMIENLELLWNKFGNTWKKFSLPISLLFTFLSYSRDDEERRTETRINPQPNYEPNSNKKHLFAENPARFSFSPSHPSHRETRVLNASEKDGSDPSGFVGAP